LGELYRRLPLPFEVFEVDLLGAGREELLRISREMGLAMSLREMEECRRYFSRRGRNPTDVELQGIAQTWSEHCYHKTFKGVVRVGRRRVRLFRDYIARVTEELSPPWCVSVFRDNAGIVEFEGEYAIAAKVETHNHPSAIEPFGGAATGVGGVIRDILGVWAEPIACLDVLGFGPLSFPHERLPPGVKHPRYIYRGVVAGIGAYGNNMGIPTVAGAIYFDESYVGNPVVYCGCVGLLRLREYVKRTRPGDFLVLAGGRTGRDGIHGVTFASLELSEESEEVSRPAVQIPDPMEEEKLRRGDPGGGEEEAGQLHHRPGGRGDLLRLRGDGQGGGLRAGGLAGEGSPQVRDEALGDLGLGVPGEDGPERPPRRTWRRFWGSSRRRGWRPFRWGGSGGGVPSGSSTPATGWRSWTWTSSSPPPRWRGGPGGGPRGWRSPASPLPIPRRPCSGSSPPPT